MDLQFELGLGRAGSDFLLSEAGQKRFLPLLGVERRARLPRLYSPRQPQSGYFHDTGWRGVVAPTGDRL